MILSLPEGLSEECALSDLSTAASRRATERPRGLALDRACQTHLDRWAGDRIATGSFDGRDVFDRTIKEIDILDNVFDSVGGRYFQLGWTPAEASPQYTCNTGASGFVPAFLARWRII